MAADEVPPVNQFEFKGAPEAFHGSVVVAVAFAAHRGGQTGLAARSTVIGAGVLNAVIRVKEQLTRRVAMEQSHAEGF